MMDLVQRLAAQHPQHEIFCLDPVVCPCSTMYRIHPGYLAWTLESLVAGEVVNRITVPGDVADPARIALERMLAAKPPAGRVETPGSARGAAASTPSSSAAASRVSPSRATPPARGCGAPSSRRTRWPPRTPSPVAALSSCIGF